MQALSRGPRKQAFSKHCRPRGTGHEVSGEMHVVVQREPHRIHDESNSGEPLDEHHCLKGRDVELRTMPDYGAYEEVSSLRQWAESI